MLVRYRLDAAAVEPRFVEVTILDGLTAPEAIAAESMAALLALRGAGSVAGWRTAGIDSVNGENWHGAAGAQQRMTAAIAARARPPTT